MTDIRPIQEGLLDRANGRRHDVISVVAVALATMLAWFCRARQRRHLRQLDDRLLRDIGLTRDEVRRETAKSPWRG